MNFEALISLDQNAKGEQTELFQAEASTWRPRLPSDPGSCQIGLHEKEAGCLVEVFRHYETPIVYLGYSLWRKMLTILRDTDDMPNLNSQRKNHNGTIFAEHAGKMGLLKNLDEVLSPMDHPFLVERRANFANLKNESEFHHFKAAAISNEQIDVVWILMREGFIDVQAETSSAKSPLHLAAELPTTRMLSLFLFGHPSFSPKSGERTSERVELLKSCDADDDFPPLFLAVRNDHVEVARFLLAAGSNADDTGSNNVTPLHLCASKNMVELLIAAGGDPRARTDMGWTPLTYVAGDGGTLGEKLYDRAGVATCLAAHGAVVDEVNDVGDTPLHVAAYYDRAPLVQVLIDAGARLETQTTSGYTALHEAASKNNEATIRVLLAAGASVEAKDNQGRTAYKLTDDNTCKLLLMSTDN